MIGEDQNVVNVAKANPNVAAAADLLKANKQLSRNGIRNSDVFNQIRKIF